MNDLLIQVRDDLYKGLTEGFQYSYGEPAAKQYTKCKNEKKASQMLKSDTAFESLMQSLKHAPVAEGVPACPETLEHVRLVHERLDELRSLYAKIKGHLESVLPPSRFKSIRFGQLASSKLEHLVDEHDEYLNRRAVIIQPEFALRLETYVFPPDKLNGYVGIKLTQSEEGQYYQWETGYCKQATVKFSDVDCGRVYLFGPDTAINLQGRVVLLEPATLVVKTGDGAEDDETFGLKREYYEFDLKKGMMVHLPEGMCEQYVCRFKNPTVYHTNAHLLHLRPDYMVGAASGVEAETSTKRARTSME